MRNLLRRLATLAGLSALLLAGSAMAAAPAMGTLTATSGPLTYSSGPFTVSNPSGTAGDIDCTMFPCDDYNLTVTLPTGYTSTHNTAFIRISTVWTVPAEDYDIYLLKKSDGSEVTHSASSSDPEVMTLTPADGTNQYVIRIIPYTVAGGTPTTTITLVDPPPAPPQQPATGTAPRYYLYPSPSDLGNSAGEPSIGYNFKTGNGMFISSLQTLKIVFPPNIKDSIDPAKAGLPAICDAQWSDVTFPLTGTETLDPILHTQSVSGRTFVSQLTGANSLFAYTDDDGANWTQGQAGPPNGGPDHQTVGTGPYPSGSPFAQIAAGAGFNYAVYYCSQGNAAAYCSRSDTGGATFANGNPIFVEQVDCNTPIGALHGHVKVSPVDGAAYVPPKDCDGQQAVTVSTDAGVNWKMKKIPSTDADTEIDPSVAIDAANRLYHCHIRANHHIHVQTSDDQGSTWGNDYDIGLAAHIETADFPEMVAGDKNRASCAFIGTETAGNHDAVDFPGIWYGFIATTYDGGKTWHTVNVTPNDPVQGVGGVCNAGTVSCGSNRNLLDFNEITMDKLGYPLFGFADGCIGACVQDPVHNNGFADKATIVRQVGGRPLIAANDPMDPAPPLAACLTGQRVPGKATLGWRAPDNGGSPITGYTVTRATAATGPFSTVGTSNKTSFVDTSVNDSVAKYYYRVTANSGVGGGPLSNFVELPITVPPPVEDSCKLPGITVLTDSDAPSPPAPQLNLLALHAAELPGSADKITLTMTLESLNPPLPNSYYLILTKDTTGANIYLQADSVNPAAYGFTYGTYAEGTAGVLTFTQVGTLDASSTVDTANGNIIFVVPRAAVKLDYAVGKSFPIDVRIRTGSQSAASRDTGGPSDYTVRGTAICALNTAPIATLDVDKSTGTAPLPVIFSVFGMDSDAGDSLASYSLDFGDGTEPITNAAFSSQNIQTVNHTYSTAGNYMAKLTVKDSHGLISSNVASKTIAPTAAGGGSSSSSGGSASSSGGVSSSSGGIIPGSTSSGRSEGRFGGGSMGLGALGLLGLAGLRRRRRPR